MRTPARRRKPTRAQAQSFPAPTGGWIENQNIAAPDLQQPGGAQLYGAALMENWFPTATGARMRAGSQLFATIGPGSLAVESLFSYSNAGNVHLFASTSAAVYDITTVVDPAVTPTAQFSGQTGGKWVSAQFATAGGVFLRTVNGVDTPRVYDGATWATTPAITVAPASSLSYVWAFSQRLFFVEKNSLNAWYLPVDVVGGAAVKFPMGGIFQKGGTLLFGGTWSLGDVDEIDAFCVFVTTEGEVAVYKGPDPAAWALVGIYQIGKPKGPKAWIRAGGDMVIATDLGYIPLSQAINRDRTGLAMGAISYPIQDAWARLSLERTGEWHCAVWPTKQMALIAYGTPGGYRDEVLVANATTGAWSLYTNWRATCLQEINNRFFFGSLNGRILEAEVTGLDVGAPYTAAYVGLFDTMQSALSKKYPRMGRVVYVAPEQLDVSLSIQVDYQINLPTAPSDVRAASSSLWGSGIWGTSVWSQARQQYVFEPWTSISGEGYALAPAVQITSGALAPPDAELIRVDATGSFAGIVS